MKPGGFIVLSLSAAITASLAGQPQTKCAPAAIGNKAAQDNPPFEIVSHKIDMDNYPMLDRPSAMSAENGDTPMTANERTASQRNRRYRSAHPEEMRTLGRLNSYVRVTDNARLVKVIVKNTGAKSIKAVEWDFAFQRYENGRLLSRYDVATKVEIKPGGQKTLKQKLPPGAKRCDIVRVAGKGNGSNNVIEMVCAEGFNYSSLLNQQQETISIKRIEYADGSVWQRP